MVQSQSFLSRNAHGRLKKRLEPSENDRFLENGWSSSNLAFNNHRGLQGAEGGHHEEVGQGMAELWSVAFFIVL
jgi:hypothetical protein